MPRERLEQTDFDKLPNDLKYGWATGTDLAIEDEHNWQFVGKATDLTEPMPVPRGRVTGGTSAINGQVFLRPIPEDFEEWVALGNDEWSFEKALPYLRKMEADTDFSDDFHSADGPIVVHRHKIEDLTDEQLAFYNACLAAGFADNKDHNHPEASGVGPYPLNNPNGVRWSTAIGYLGPARHRLNLTLRPNCTTRRVLFEGDRAVGVEVESEGEVFSVYGRSIVLSAGAIASPQLLMLSGIGPTDQLEALGIPVIKHAPGVGQNLRDHPAVHVRWQPKPHVKMPPEAVGPQKVALRYTAPGSDLRNDMTTVMRYWTERKKLVMSVGIYLARSSGELRLASTDVNTQPVLDYNYLSEPFDRQRLREGVRQCLRLAEHPEFSDLIESLEEPTEGDLASDDALDNWALRNVTTMHHISCTCRMGVASDPMAVVDQHGRVHGLQGLRIADVSILPDCTRANTNIPAMMIGERVADFIRDGS